LLVMVIDEMANWMRPDNTAGNSPLNGMFSIFTVLPVRLATSLTRSISKPTNLPCASWNSQGTLPMLAPTTHSAARAGSAKDAASANAATILKCFMPELLMFAVVPQAHTRQVVDMLASRSKHFKSILFWSICTRAAPASCGAHVTIPSRCIRAP